MMKMRFLVVLMLTTLTPLMAAEWSKTGWPMNWATAKIFCNKKGMRLPSSAEFNKNISKRTPDKWNFYKTYWLSDNVGRDKAKVAQPHPFNPTRFATVPQSSKYQLVRCFK